ncbi:MAG: nucleotide exchange factor GrpE [Candidatus Sungbacteria bacterium]|nr:nucleotide exchange factor GrpE [Candidatus Sungbacteria bacterium]
MDDIEIGNPADEEGDGADPLAKLKRLREKLKHCEKEKEEYLLGWQRAKAELLNAKRDEMRRMVEWRERLEDATIFEFLAVLDSFELAMSASHERHMSPELKRGFDLIRLQFVDILRKLGVSEIEAKGTFNPAFHEVIEEVEADAEAGSVVETLQKGFKRGERVLRPTRVKVAKPKS